LGSLVPLLTGMIPDLSLSSGIPSWHRERWPPMRPTWSLISAD